MSLIDVAAVEVGLVDFTYEDDVGILLLYLGDCPLPEGTEESVDESVESVASGT